MIRPTSWSVWARNPAYTSISRDAMRWRCSGSESHAGSDSWRSVSSASAGITPNRFCRAKISSRSTSQPWSKRPRNGSLHSGATWWGAWVAPGAQ